MSFSAPLGTLVESTPCPEPLIEMPDVEGKNLVTCVGRCCLRCPLVSQLYPTNRLDNLNRVTVFVRIVSAALAAFVSISYIVLPGKRNHPAIIILFFSLALTLWMACIGFSFPDPRQVQCADQITQATMDNSNLCQIQGTFLMLFSHLVCFWCALLILNLHLNAVWKSNFIERHFHIAHLLCWAAPLGFTLASYFTKEIQYEFGATCLISQDGANKFFFYPLSVIIFPAFTIHTWTFFHIFRVTYFADDISSDSNQSISTVSSANRRRNATKAFMIQWRPLLLAFVFMTTFIFFWLFYFIELKKLANLKTSTVVRDWLKCILDGRGQNACADLIASELPSFPLMVLTDILIALAGFWLFVIFGARKSLLVEWKDFASNMSVRRRSKFIY
ncbi:hypothetical protein BKA69DRAFT_436095 [Paraphysoderma sedebokerense]|nr:hypothetical protein BKA69DRAFT_436095 [Paraphysoderma sedebokerense]